MPKFKFKIGDLVSLKGFPDSSFEVIDRYSNERTNINYYGITDKHNAVLREEKDLQLKTSSKKSTQCIDLNSELQRLGITDSSVRSYNPGTSDYSQHIIQPWAIWLDYNLNPWDADIVKRVLRTKSGDSRKLDYEKIIHICKERIRQLTLEN